MNIASSRLPKYSSDLINGSNPSHSPTLMKRLLHKYSHSAPRASPPPRLLLVLLLSAQILFLAIIRLGPSSSIWSTSKLSSPSGPSVALPYSLPVDFSAQDEVASLKRLARDADDRASVGTSSDESETSSAAEFSRAVTEDAENENLVRNEDAQALSEELLQQPSGSEQTDASASEKKKKKTSSRKKKEKESEPDRPKENIEDVSLTSEQTGETQSNGAFSEKEEDTSLVSKEVSEGADRSVKKTEDKLEGESTDDNAILESLDVEEKQDLKENSVQEEAVSEVDHVESEIKEVEWKESNSVSLIEDEKEKTKPSVSESEEAVQEEIIIEGKETGNSEKKHESDLVQKEEVQPTEEEAVPETQSVEDKSFDANAQTEALAVENQSVEEQKTENVDAPSENVTAEKQNLEEKTSTMETEDKNMEDQNAQAQAQGQSFIVQKSSEETSSSECPNGYIYVYDLPQIFNHDITANCTALNPWSDVCPNLSNGGLGESLEDASPLGQKGSWFITNPFTAEVVFHNRMLQHPCLTDKQEVASGFYVPFYAGLDVGRYLWAGSTVEQRDRLGNQLLEWLAQQSAWKRNGGRDHFLMIGRITWDFRRSKDEDWGSGFFHHPAMQNTTRLVIERDPWDDIEMAVPYLTNFHPQSDADLRAWQNHIRNYKRTTLFSFAGARRERFPDDFRAILFKQCQQAEQCRSLDCSNRTCEDSQNTMQLFMDSTFCLQPRGDSFTRRSTFDCLLAGTIPVFFWHRSAYLQYKWHLPTDESSYSVFISKADLRNNTQIEDVLKSLPQEKVKSMQEAVIQMVPRLVYAVSGFSLKEEKDAFDVAIDGVMKSFKGYL